MLVGEYQSWSPGFSNNKAAQFAATTAALVNTVPFIVGVGADCLLGDYWTLLIVLFAFFIPGSLLIFLSSWPYLLGDTFPFQVFKSGMLYLYPIGGGGIDTIVDIFAAKQFHPILQDDQIEKFYVWAFVANAAGGMLSTVGYSMIGNVSVPGTFLFMFVTVVTATFLYCLYSKRYVVRKIKHKWVVLTWKAGFQAMFCWKKSEEGQLVPAVPGFGKVKESNGGSVRDDLVDAAKRLLLIIPVQGIFIPLSIPYTQMPTFMIPQSYSMAHPPLWSGSSMFTVQGISSVLTGIFANLYFYPYLERKNIFLSTTKKVSIGAAVMTVSYLIMYGVDQRIRSVYTETEEMINIGWQALVYIFSGIAFTFFLPPMDEASALLRLLSWNTLVRFYLSLRLVPKVIV